MKKLLSVLMVLAMVLSLCACGGQNSNTTSSKTLLEHGLDVIATMDEMAGAIDENEAAMAEIDECLDDIYDELDDIDDYLEGDFDDDDEDDDDDFDEDDYVELECPECGEAIYFDEAMLECGEELLCPNCNAVLVPVLEEDDED